ncbi:MAG: trigger factor [Candidatus Nanopelagicales bacterium]
MKIDIERLSETAVKLSVHLDYVDFEPAIKQAYRAVAEKINIKGFRKGKVPEQVIDNQVGRAYVVQEALNDAISSAYEKAVRDNELKPVGQPEVEVTELEDRSHIAFTAEVEVRPEFDVPEYSSVKVEVDAVVVDDDAVNEQLESLQKRFSNYTAVDRAAADGDVLLVDIAGTYEGEAVADLTANALSYELGTDGILPGFDDAVRGANRDDVRTFEFTPEAGEYEGKSVSIAVTVKNVREQSLPALDDDFAQLASEFDTLEELRADLADKVMRMKRIEQGYQARDRIQDVLLSMIDVPLPEKFLNRDIDEHFKDNHGDEAHRQEYIDGQRRSLKAQFILDKIAETEKLSVSEAELSTWLMQQAPRYGMTPQEFADALVQSGGVQMALADVRRVKALEVVLQSANVVDSNGDVVDLSELDELMAQ